ncbi:MAG: ABC transporter substrate-binding protein [Cyanobacteria bacterium P01_E01_bin.6]
MMRWRSFLAIMAVSAVIVLGVSLSNLSNHMQEEALVLQIATTPDYCPYEFVETINGISEIAGFDIDLAKAIGAEVGSPVQFDSMPFNQLLLALRSQEADLAIAALTPTDERKKIVNFSVVYHETESVIVTPADSKLETLADIAGQRIGVRPGTIHAQLAETVTNSDIVLFDDTNGLIKALNAGEIGAAILDRAIADRYIRHRWKLNRLVVENDDSAGVAIAFPKRSPLLRSVNQILRQMKTDGTIDDLAVKWFDEYICSPVEES